MNAESRTGARQDEPLLISSLVARQASLTPDAVAVVEGDHTTTYAQLDARANQLAHYLISLGVGPDVPVGVCLYRGLDLVVALLGVWRAGGAYLPFTPDLHPQLLTKLLRRTGAGIVLTETETAGVIRGAGARPVIPDAVRSELEALPTELPAVAAHPANAAYILHTSGSTGEPKGVVVSNAGIANRVAWAVGTCGLGPEDRVLQKTTVTFDAHCWEVFGPLTSGGAVVLAPLGAESDPAAMVGAIRDRGVTVLQVVPSVLRLIAEEPALADCASLRLVFSAGEPLHAELVQRVLEKVSVTVWNTYGPTECSIDVTAHQVDPAQLTGPIPIGRPIRGLRALVVDQAGRPVGPGTAGELLAGGTGVARGYFGRPALTAASFVPDPFAGDGSRLYRTGDRVRWRRDGVLEYLGRIDDQVKVNGVRIEPAEVEHALAAHPGVTGAAVAAYEAPDGGKRLAAYLVARPGLELGELRQFLLQRLPASQIPSSFVLLDALPLGSTGKVDRRALPVPGSLDAAGRPVHRAPVTPAERAVAATWQEVLKIDQVGLDDDFFQLGGTSLQLTRLVSRLRAATGADVQLRGFFGATTLSAQAELLSAGQPQGPRPVPRTGPLPLSYGQQRLWFVDRMNPGGPEWVAGIVLRLTGEVTAAAAQLVLDSLVERHEALRTRFPLVDGEPVQVIDPPAPVTLRVSTGDVEHFHALLGEDQAIGFDLATGPLLRAVLVHSPEPGGDSRLGIMLHHIATDGWSTAVLEREFRELLDAHRTGRTADLPALPIQYADYAAWQQKQLTDDVLQRELAHWREELAGFTPLELQTDHPRPAIRDGRGSVVPFEVPAEVAGPFLELGRSKGATPFMALLTAYATVLARHTGQWDVPVGTPVSGRDCPETEHVVGFFLNSLVLRCRLDAGLSFEQALAAVRQSATTAFSHQDLPFDRLVEDIAPERDLSRTPIFQVAFDLHDGEFNGLIDEQDDPELLKRLWQATHTDLTLNLRTQPDGSLIGGLEYDNRLFEEGTVARLAGHLCRLLAAAVAAPAQPLAELPILSSEDLAQLAVWGTAPGEQPELTVPEQIARQAAATPEAVAVAGEGFSLTYAELDAAANRLAHHLTELGAGPERAVGVLLDRGAELVTALLAVWRAGAAYIPLDPSFPAERISRMLDEAGAAAVVTGHGHADRFDGARPLVDLDRDASGLAALPATAPAAPADPDGLAYAIFTSGSTGRPKGVAVSHRGLANHVRWAAAELAGRGEGGSALFSSAAFDLVVPNIWAPLTVGQRVWILPQDLDGQELGRRLVEAGPFSFLKLTPGHLEIITHQVTAEQAAALAGVVVVAGEALPGTLADRWAGWLGADRLVNEYGPTEASVGTCILPLTAPVGYDTVPIGRPLPGMIMRVLDETMRPVPVGAPGELYVGGTGVARGYLGRPALTAERFLPDPYGEPGSRLYRTGDQARWLPEGVVEFLGRNDDQVKVRGYRIELGEVRAAVLDHPAVREAAVVTVTQPSGGLALAAYVVLDGELPDLAAHCAARLPEYMVPTSFTELAAMPLNANGKVDRGRLPDPVPAEAEAAEQTGPRNIVEEHILGIWTELLGVRVGVHDNFFYTGGNSILAIRLIANLQDLFQLDLPVRVIFEAPTIAGLALVVEERIRTEIDQLSDSEIQADSILPKEHHA
ncbi:Non-ribosomal peptide synthetase [Kitasatospora sp. MMS16-BH015]|uniref:non-ribosomal peptide synthetase n=1 Tax=Kitasatospora sp. MMS16-BH015 TaxID=2018025 RepID=UPI000CA23754|nr:non-ribosomal peptide synthetase [Kitasatospora sp. MMS16-BH015]AUG78197.1 Non-ribosomal peptide synthetase [Kitasatospora sp. MMS16-BH015]